jgi:hypothetical protein
MQGTKQKSVRLDGVKKRGRRKIAEGSATGLEGGKVKMVLKTSGIGGLGVVVMPVKIGGTG